MGFQDDVSGGTALANLEVRFQQLKKRFDNNQMIQIFDPLVSVMYC